MTIDSAAARWLLTAVFVAAALTAVLSRGRQGDRDRQGERRRGGERARPTRPDWAETAFCLVMCAALIAMAWWTEPAAVAWAQVAVFGCAAIAFLAGWRTRPLLDRLYHALMAGAMIWMLLAVPAAAAMPSAGMPGTGMPRAGVPRGEMPHAGMPAAHGAMAAMTGAGLPFPALAFSALVAACCAATCVPWLARAIGPGLRIRDPAAAGQAAMSAGMAAMLVAML